MARLTNHDYLKNHELLRANRAADNTAFVMLDANEQWDLFRYYLPHEARGYPALIAHRAEISRLDPSLPQRAGRAFQKFLINKENLPAYREYARSKPRTKKNAKRKVVVFGEVKPELDPKQFARIILQAAHEQIQHKNHSEASHPRKID